MKRKKRIQKLPKAENANVIRHLIKSKPLKLFFQFSIEKLRKESKQARSLQSDSKWFFFPTWTTQQQQQQQWRVFKNVIDRLGFALLNSGVENITKICHMQQSNRTHIQNF